jgi:urea transport system substrate-binding protein
MAIDEVNNEGGVLGHEIKPVIVDPASDPTRFATLAQKLIDEHRVTAIFGCWTSASRKAVRPIIERSKSLLFYPVQYEGLEISPRIVYTGPAPNQQLLPAIDFIIDTLKRRRIMLVGSDYVFPRTAHEIIRDRITERQDTGARIVGEIVRPLGKKKWLTALVQLKQSEPDFIINTINGNSAFAFYEQWRQFERTQGLARVPILSVSLTENEFRGISTDDSWGDYLIASYFQSVETPASRVFTQKIRERYGDNRVTSCMMAAAYDGVYFWKKAVERAKGFDTTNVINNLRGISVTGPRGEVTIDSDTLHTYLPVRIAQVQRSGDLSILPGNDTPIKPVPFPPSRSMNDWLLSLEKLYFSYNSNWYAPIANE